MSFFFFFFLFSILCYQKATQGIVKGRGGLADMGVSRAMLPPVAFLFYWWFGGNGDGGDVEVSVESLKE